MQGEFISLGMVWTLLTPAELISNRTFEIFENIWGIYRDRETQDPLINATIEMGIPTGVDAGSVNDMQLLISPNPASDAATVQYSVPGSNEKVWLVITDMQGKIISRRNIGNSGEPSKTVTINTENFASGMYFVELYAGKNRKIEKLIVGD